MTTPNHYCYLVLSLPQRGGCSSCMIQGFCPFQLPLRPSKLPRSSLLNLPPIGNGHCPLWGCYGSSATQSFLTRMRFNFIETGGAEGSADHLALLRLFPSAAATAFHEGLEWTEILFCILRNISGHRSIRFSSNSYAL